MAFLGRSLAISLSFVGAMLLVATLLMGFVVNPSLRWERRQARGQVATVDVIVADRALPLGHVVTEDDLRLRTLARDLAGRLPRRWHLDRVVGKTVMIPIDEGTPLAPHRLWRPSHTPSCEIARTRAAELDARCEGHGARVPRPQNPGWQCEDGTLLEEAVP